MADEINIQASVSLQRSTIGLSAADALPRDQAGTKGYSLNVTAPVSSDTTGLEVDVAFNIGFLYVKNLDTSIQASSKDVNISLVDFDPTPQIFARLRSNEFCLIPMSSLTITKIYVRSVSGVTVPLQIVAIQQ